MKSIRINTTVIVDWPSFHAEFQRALGFPDFYGANMDAWIDCLQYLRDADAGMTTVLLEQDEVLCLELPNAEQWRQRVPEIVSVLWDCTAFVNHSYGVAEGSSALTLLPLGSEA